MFKRCFAEAFQPRKNRSGKPHRTKSPSNSSSPSAPSYLPTSASPSTWKQSASSLLAEQCSCMARTTRSARQKRATSLRVWSSRKIAGCMMVVTSFPRHLRLSLVRRSGCRASRRPSSASISLRLQKATRESLRAFDQCAGPIYISSSTQFRSFATARRAKPNKDSKLFILHRQSFLQSC
jgi:hypothetical protein